MSTDPEKDHLSAQVLRWQQQALEWEQHADRLAAESGAQQALLRELQARLSDAALRVQRIRERQQSIGSSKPYRLAYFLRRLEHDFFKGNRAARLSFLRWLGQRLRGQQALTQDAEDPFIEPAAQPPTAEAEAQQSAEARRLLAEVTPRLRKTPGRPTIALQLDSFDKGGLEELVFGLARNLTGRGCFNLFVFVNDIKAGYLARQALGEGISVVLLHRNRLFLQALIRALELKLVNLHYSIFGIEQYAEAGVKVVYTVHSNYLWADDETFFRQRKAAYDQCHSFIAVSTQVRRFFVDRFQMQDRSVTTIPNGLDLERLPLPLPLTKQALGLGQDDFVFINISSLSWLKHQVLLLAAIERLRPKYPQFRLLLMGNIIDQACADCLKQMVAKRGLGESVKILAYAPKEAVFGLMRMADCFVLPSLTEGCSISVLEAMYCQIPMILTEVGAAGDVIEDSDIGLLIPPPYSDIRAVTPAVVLEKYAHDGDLANLDSLCAAMEAMHAQAAAWREKARKGREKLEARFSVQRTASGYLEEFARVLQITPPGE